MRRTIFTTPLFYTWITMISMNMRFDGTNNMVYAKRGPHHPRSEIDKERPSALRTMDEHFGNDIEHIKEDLGDLLINDKNISDMTEDEKNFYYFKLHDSDNNDFLDGLELLQAATHHSTHHHLQTTDTNLNFNDELGHIIDVIDDFISFADFNNDGFLNYPEYSKAIKKPTGSGESSDDDATKSITPPPLAINNENEMKPVHSDEGML